MRGQASWLIKFRLNHYGRGSTQGLGTHYQRFDPSAQVGCKLADYSILDFVIAFNKAACGSSALTYIYIERAEWADWQRAGIPDGLHSLQVGSSHSLCPPFLH